MGLTNEDLLAISNLLDSKLKPIENKLDNVENRLDSVENKLDSVENKLDNVENRLDSVENRLDTIELTLENDIKPRLDTIESCYTDTYERYKNYADKMEGTFTDIEIMEKVIAEHSEKLQKISIA